MPVNELAYAHAGGPANIFLYCFNYTSRSVGDRGGGSAPAAAGGASHGDELSYVFGAPIADGIDPFLSVYTKADKAFSEIVMKYWANFIKTG